MFRYVSLILMTSVQILASEEKSHHQQPAPENSTRPPRVFLDKSPRIIAYQLRRLDNAQLLLIQTSADDPKYIPVFRTILLREGMARKDRDDALNNLAAVKETDTVTELLTVLKSLDFKDGNQHRVGREISSMLLSEPAEVLDRHIEDLKNAVLSDSRTMAATAHAALIITDHTDASWQVAQTDEESQLSWLAAVSLVPTGSVRQEMRSQVVSLLASSYSRPVRKSAIQALVAIQTEAADTFRRLAPFVSIDGFRAAAVESLLSVPDDARDGQRSKQIVEVLVSHAEHIPAAQRTTDDFLDAMQLADELLSRVSASEAMNYRHRLQMVTVRVVRLKTVEEEMRFDRPFFAVQAGRPVQLILENDDLMPHNLVITAPGQLRTVALAAAALGTMPGLDGKLYVPDSADVLFSTKMVNAGSRTVLTFNAPAVIGEYPYVCTFPRHWMRMYGVMVVVPDLDAWRRNPVPPRDPLGNSRSLVHRWKTTDFSQNDLMKTLRSRSPQMGARLFKEATCLGCHKMNGEGGDVGPELTDVLKRLQNDHVGVLREILEPSYRIDSKYAVKIVVDIQGRTTSGIVTAEDSTAIAILVNPEAPDPTVIRKDNIDEIIPSTTSMMPKSLLDKFTYDEIMEILSYITKTGH